MEANATQKQQAMQAKLPELQETLQIIELLDVKAVCCRLTQALPCTELTNVCP